MTGTFRGRAAGAVPRVKDAAARARRALLAALAAFGCLASLLPASVACAAGSRQGPPPAAAASGHDATVHHAFDDAERWSRVFDDPTRDEWQKPAEVVEALGLRAGMVVADLGAGTGYFESSLSRAVGPTGLVLAIDSEPAMVTHLGSRAKTDRLENVLPILALPEDPFLPAARVDRVLVVDTYHHIDDRLAYFSRMRSALAPGGLVVVIDFHKRPLPVGPPPEHKIERAAVVDEMVEAGFRLADEKSFLPYQYLLMFAPGAVGSGAAAPRDGSTR